MHDLTSSHVWHKVEFKSDLITLSPTFPLPQVLGPHDKVMSAILLSFPSFTTLLTISVFTQLQSLFLFLSQYRPSTTTPGKQALSQTPSLWCRRSSKPPEAVIRYTDYNVTSIWAAQEVHGEKRQALRLKRAKRSELAKTHPYTQPPREKFIICDVLILPASNNLFRITFSLLLNWGGGSVYLEARMAFF